MRTSILGILNFNGMYGSIVYVTIATKHFGLYTQYSNDRNTNVL